MALRAPIKLPRVYIEADHTIEGHWEETRWWRVCSADGHITILETSDPAQAVEEQQQHDGARLQRRYEFRPAVCQYREETPWIPQDSEGRAP